MRITLLFFAVLLAVAKPGMAQNPNLVTLEIDVNNGIGYETDSFEYEKLGTSATPVPRKVPTRPFADFSIIYDVVSVNGQPVKGAMVFRSNRLSMNPNPAPGQSIGDMVRGTIGTWVIEILNPDGSQIGSLMMTGFPNGDPPPGSPLSSSTHNMAITGGTGMFLGARGYFGGAAQPFHVPNQGTFQSLSSTSDPATRRNLNGGTFGHIAQFVPMIQPIIREVLHADLTPVSASNPAARGEMLILRASGLGPVKGRALGQVFPETPVAEVMSPVDVTIGGVTVKAINKLGWPGETDLYRVDIQVPETAPAGTATVRLSCGWIPSAATTIAIR